MQFEYEKKIQEQEKRIDELEGALRSCRRVLELQRTSVNHFNVAAGDAIAEANAALGSPTG